MASINEILLDGEICLELKADKYRAILAPSLGNNVLRFQDIENKIEVFRVNKEHPYETAKENPEVYGYPFLYFPNRLDKGVLKTSDAVYHFPINEKLLENSIHGFLHKRPYQVIKREITDEDTVKVVSEFEFQQEDEFFSYFPVEFTVKMIYTLSKYGLNQQVEIKNMSDRMLPIGVGSHTPINAPFLEGTKEEEYFISIPAEERWKLDERCLPLKKEENLSEYDKEYKIGNKHCVGRNIDNDLYTAGMNSLDGKEFYGAVITHAPTGKKICYEVSPEYGFWLIWNDKGDKQYVCPEPMTWIIDAPNLKYSKDETGYVEIRKNEKFCCSQTIFTK